MGINTLVEPAAGTSAATVLPHTKQGIALGAIGLLIAMVTVVANFSAASALEAGDGIAAGKTLAWSFGLTTLAFGTAKVGIAVILVGILIRIWFRLDAVKATMPRLASGASDSYRVGSTSTTDYGEAAVTREAPTELPIHKMARTMWAPMLAMGMMALLAGTATAFSWSSNVGVDAIAATQSAMWAQGLQFLGEAFLLSGISFLLGSILGQLRRGGGEVQHQLGLPVVTLKMPATAKTFVVLMMLGLMAGITQFVLYVVGTTITDPTQIAVAGAWLGPLRELSLGLLLSGIVLALATIANVLGFQFNRLNGVVTGA
jgi:hypothetical protein